MQQLNLWHLLRHRCTTTSQRVTHMPLFDLRNRPDSPVQLGGSHWISTTQPAHFLWTASTALGQKRDCDDASVRSLRWYSEFLTPIPRVHGRCFELVTIIYPTCNLGVTTVYNLVNFICPDKPTPIGYSSEKIPTGDDLQPQRFRHHDNPL